MRNLRIDRFRGHPRQISRTPIELLKMTASALTQFFRPPSNPSPLTRRDAIPPSTLSLPERTMGVLVYSTCVLSTQSTVSNIGSTTAAAAIRVGSVFVLLRQKSVQLHNRRLWNLTRNVANTKTKASCRLSQPHGTTARRRQMS